MQLRTEWVDDLMIVRVDDDRIDAAVAIEFKDEMRALTGEGTGDVVLDVSRVRFVDSSGLGALVAVLKALLPDRRLALAAPMPNVRSLLSLTRMDSVFQIMAEAPAAAARARHG